MEKTQSLEELKAELKELEETKWHQALDGMPNTGLFLAMLLLGIFPPILIQQIYRNHKKKKLREKIADLEKQEK